MKHGYTLLEVLISMFVLLVGLLGMMSLTMVGIKNAVDARRADDTATCARLAIDDINIRGWLDSARWTHDGITWCGIDIPPIIIDPNGRHNGVTDNVLGIPRVSLLNVIPNEYTSYDDLIFDYDPDRPTLYGRQQYYTWFATVCNGTLTAVVCHKRQFDEQIFDTQIAGVLGHGTIPVPANIEIKQGQFLLLVYNNKMEWYKVRSDVYDGHIDISGGDITIPVDAKAVLFDNVVGICSKTFDSPW